MNRRETSPTDDAHRLLKLAVADLAARIEVARDEAARLEAVVKTHARITAPLGGMGPKGESAVPGQDHIAEQSFLSLVEVVERHNVFLQHIFDRTNTIRTDLDKVAEISVNARKDAVYASAFASFGETARDLERALDVLTDIQFTYVQRCERQQPTLYSFPRLFNRDIERSAYVVEDTYRAYRVASGQLVRLCFHSRTAAEPQKATHRRVETVLSFDNRYSAQVSGFPPGAGGHASTGTLDAHFVVHGVGYICEHPRYLPILAHEAAHIDLHPDSNLGTPFGDDAGDRMAESLEALRTAVELHYTERTNITEFAWLDAHVTELVADIVALFIAGPMYVDAFFWGGVGVHEILPTYSTLDKRPDFFARVQLMIQAVEWLAEKSKVEQDITGPAFSMEPPPVHSLRPSFGPRAEPSTDREHTSTRVALERHLNAALGCQRERAGRGLSIVQAYVSRTAGPYLAVARAIQQALQGAKVNEEFFYVRARQGPHTTHVNAIARLFDALIGDEPNRPTGGQTTSTSPQSERQRDPSADERARHFLWRRAAAHGLAWRVFSDREKQGTNRPIEFRRLMYADDLYRAEHHNGPPPIAPVRCAIVRALSHTAVVTPATFDQNFAGVPSAPSAAFHLFGPADQLYFTDHRRGGQRAPTYEPPTVSASNPTNAQTGFTRRIEFLYDDKPTQGPSGFSFDALRDLTSPAFFTRVRFARDRSNCHAFVVGWDSAVQTLARALGPGAVVAMLRSTGWDDLAIIWQRPTLGQCANAWTDAFAPIDSDPEAAKQLVRTHTAVLYPSTARRQHGASAADEHLRVFFVSECTFTGLLASAVALRKVLAELSELGRSGSTTRFDVQAFTVTGATDVAVHWSFGPSVSLAAAADVVWSGLFELVKATSGHVLTTQTRFVAAELMGGLAPLR